MLKEAHQQQGSNQGERHLQLIHVSLTDFLLHGLYHKENRSINAAEASVEQTQRHLFVGEGRSVQQGGKEIVRRTDQQMNTFGRRKSDSSKANPDTKDHAHQSASEGVKEPDLVPSQALHQRSRPRVQEQGLVRGQQPHLGLQVAVVHVVEGEGGLHVERRDHVVVAAGAGARHPQRLEEPQVDGGVGLPGAAEVVQPAHELLAVGEADGVGP